MFEPHNWEIVMKKALVQHTMDKNENSLGTFSFGDFQKRNRVFLKCEYQRVFGENESIYIM